MSTPMSFPITGFQQSHDQKICCFNKNAPQKSPKKSGRIGGDIGNDNIKSPPYQGGVARSAEGVCPINKQKKAGKPRLLQKRRHHGLMYPMGPDSKTFAVFPLLPDPLLRYMPGRSAENMLISMVLLNSLIYIKNFVIFTSYLRFKINTYGFYCHTGIIFPLRVLFIIYVWRFKF